jgi:hypothetical protein
MSPPPNRSLAKKYIPRGNEDPVANTAETFEYNSPALVRERLVEDRGIVRW